MPQSKPDPFAGFDAKQVLYYLRIFNISDGRINQHYPPHENNLHFRFRVHGMAEPVDVVITLGQRAVDDWTDSVAVAHLLAREIVRCTIK